MLKQRPAACEEYYSPIYPSVHDCRSFTGHDVLMSHLTDTRHVHTHPFPRDMSIFGNV